MENRTIKRKTLKELTLKDNFMFGAVMCKEENCKRLLELILEIPIEHVEVSKEKCMVYHPEYKGVRLDVYAKEPKGAHYNVEMQAVRQEALGKRARYYHSQIDMDLLAAGAEYIELPNTYVIFICDFDPFYQGKCRYTFYNQCHEVSDLTIGDGSATIFLNTQGENLDEISVELKAFLRYMRADLHESTKNFHDPFVRDLQKTVLDIKASRRMEERYMLTELLMQDERRAGRREGEKEGLRVGREMGLLEGYQGAILTLLTDIGSIPNELDKRILEEKDIKKLNVWMRLAAKVDTVEQFIEMM